MTDSICKGEMDMVEGTCKNTQCVFCGYCNAKDTCSRYMDHEPSYYMTNKTEPLPYHFISDRTEVKDGYS